MSATATINALQTLHDGLTGVAAPQLASYPADLSTSTLTAAGLAYPLILTFLANGTAEGSAQVGRTYKDYFNAVALVGRSNQTNAAASQAAVAALKDSLTNLYTTNERLNSTTYLLLADLQHSGWRDDINIAGTAHAGIVFSLRIKEQE